MDSPDQPSLWYDSIDEATKYDVAFLGGPKAVGSMLRPELTIDKASDWLSACLNPERREKLDIDQYKMIWLAAKRKGSMTGLAQVCRECECADPVAVEPEDQQMQLIKRYVEATQQLSAIAERIERTGLSLKAVK